MDFLAGKELFVQIYILVVVGILGAIFGSFLNVVALRLLWEESIVFPPSKCPKCKTKLQWYDNIPVLGYLFLGGKCRYCKESISVQYPLVEAFTSLIFIGVFLAFGLSLKSLFLLILSCGLIVMTVTDLKEKVIYDIISLPLIPLGLIYSFFDIGNVSSGMVNIPLEGIGQTLVLNQSFVSAFWGMLLGAAVFEIFSGAGVLMVGQRAFGFGDTLIAAALGAWFGWKMLLVIVGLSFILQLIVGIPLILVNMYKDKDYKSLMAMGIMCFAVAVPYIGNVFGFTENIFGALATTFVSFAFALAGIVIILKRTKQRQNFTVLPFGPALVLAGFLTMFWGQVFLNWYQNLFS